MSAKPSLTQDVVSMKPYDDPRKQTVTVDSVLASMKAHDEERIKAGYPPDYRHSSDPKTSCPSAIYGPEHPTKEQLEILTAQDALFAMIRTYGSKRVIQWARNLAVIAGEKV